MHFHRLAQALVFLITAGFSPAICHADGGGLFGGLPNDVFIVTDYTDAGKQVARPTPDSPAYYKAINFGCDYGSIDGDRIPKSRKVSEFLVRILAKQGFRGTNEANPPTLYLAFQWGYLRGSLAQNILYLGGDKVGLSSELQTYGLNPGLILRGMRGRMGNKVMSIAQDDLYALTISAYDYATAETDNPVMLWQTRIAVPANGLSMAKALPMMATLAGPLIGLESNGPVTRDPIRDRKGVVEYGELEVLGVE